MTKPEKKFSLKGVVATVWNNPRKDGTSFCSVTLERRYCDESGVWKSSGSFSGRSLQCALTLLGQAAAYIEAKEAPRAPTAVVEDTPRAPTAVVEDAPRAPTETVEEEEEEILDDDEYAQ